MGGEGGRGAENSKIRRRKDDRRATLSTNTRRKGSRSREKEGKEERDQRGGVSSREVVLSKKDSFRSVKKGRRKKQDAGKLDRGRGHEG